MDCHVDGLTTDQWGFCLIVGFSALIWNFILKFVPERFCPTLGNEDPKDIKEAFEDY